MTPQDEASDDLSGDDDEEELAVNERCQAVTVQLLCHHIGRTVSSLAPARPNTLVSRRMFCNGLCQIDAEFT
eukprot:780734-Amphidinium_carterae.1